MNPMISFLSLLLLFFLYPLPSSSKSFTVSGLSSGAFMSVQIHVAWSGSVSGVGVIAGGPYWCAQANANTAVALMTNPNLINIDQLVNATTYAYNTGTIDNPNGIRNAQVWLFSGSLDSVVVPGVVGKTRDYYGRYGAPVTYVSNIAAQHAIVTNNYGNACNYLGGPYINNCGYDTVQNMWSRIIGGLNPKKAATSSNLRSFTQGSYTGIYTPAQCGLASTGYVYVPSGCSTFSSCRLHLALHGCSQNYGTVGNAFVWNAGYNDWAEGNNIIVLYPQTTSSGVNPNSCFDWWGYTGSNYATRGGIQMAAIYRMVQAYS